MPDTEEKSVAPIEDSDEPKPAGSDLAAAPDPAVRRSMSRRGLIREEFGRASLDVVKKLPAFGPVLGMAFKQSAAAREEELVQNLWLLLTNRKPSAEEARAGLQVLREARTPEDRGDALVDLLWALCQTEEFESLQRPPRAVVRGLYLIALGRQPSDEELATAEGIIREADESRARGGALEGLLTGLFRSAESVFRKEPFLTAAKLATGR